MTAAARTTESRDGTTITFDRAGDGPPVVLVGGAFQHRWIDGKAARLAELLSPQFTVFHYDRRGRGDSGDTSPYAVEREVEDLAAVVAEAGGAAAVFGMSSGGSLALHAAATGVAMTKLALYEPPFTVDGSRPRLPEDLGTRLDELVASGRRGDAVALFLTQAVGVPADGVGQMRAAPVWPALERVAHTLGYDMRVMGDGAVPSELIGSLTVPALVIDGDASPAWAREAVRAVAEALPGGERRSLAGQTHDVDPELLAPVLARFFAR
jgi:pimeloyl-ACP methyl ester carboxylesterase